MPRGSPQWWSARVDGSFDEFRDGIVCVSSQYLIVQEEAEQTKKQHLHAVFLSHFSESKIRKMIFFQLSGSQLALHKILDDKELRRTEQYICKGTHHEFQTYTELCKDEMAIKEIVHVINPKVYCNAKSKVRYTNDYVKECHDAYWTENKQVQEYKADKEKKNMTFIGMVAFEIKKQKSKGDINIEFNSCDPHFRRFVRKQIYSFLRSKEKGFDTIIVRRLCNGVMNILDPRGMEEYMERLIDQTLDDV